ncbi:MAG: hypothetical protein RIT81_41970 [Deltaproteobacteria bacterium]
MFDKHLTGLVVLGIGLVQFAAGLLAPRRIDEMLVSSGILALAAVILFTWRSQRARQVVIGLLGVSIAVFFVLMLRAPQEVPRTLVLGLVAAAVVVFMRR